MSAETALVPANIHPGTFFTPDQVALIKRQIAKGVADDELQLFLYQCARTGLDPFSRQIYAIPRKEWDSKTRTETWKMSIQTGIDGLRLIADRTGRYAPGPDNTYEYDAASNLRKATAHVLKRTADGTWHTISASAFYSEYAQTTKEGKPTKIWAEKPHIMLGKCAEALALRKAFPAEMSGIYTSDEMGQTEVAAPPEYTPPATPATSPTKDTTPPPPAGAPSLTVVRSSDPGESAAAAAAAPAPVDTGEAVTDQDLDDLEELAFKELKLKKPYFRNWVNRYFKVLPDAWTKAQMADAMAILLAMGMGTEQYRAKLAELFAAGRIAAGPEEA